MKSVYLLVLVSLCQGLPLETRVLSAPSNVGLTIRDPPAIEVTWNKVDSADDEYPVLGYKVLVWEVKKINNTVYNFVDDKVSKTTEELEEPIKQRSGPTGSPTEIVTTADQTTATYPNVKMEVTYEIRVQAYTKRGEGPMSNAFRVKLIDKKKAS